VRWRKTTDDVRMMATFKKKRILAYVALLGALVIALPFIGLLNRSFDSPQNRERWKPCRSAADTLVGSPWELVRQRCGMWSKSETATTSRGHLIRLHYGSYFEGGPFFSILVVNGVVESVIDYPAP
jgi:hypothetical protein